MKREIKKKGNKYYRKWKLDEADKIIIFILAAVLLVVIGGKIDV